MTKKCCHGFGFLLGLSQMASRGAGANSVFALKNRKQPNQTTSEEQDEV
jgi:hypothetical protein